MDSCIMNTTRDDPVAAGRGIVAILFWIECRYLVTTHSLLTAWSSSGIHLVVATEKLKSDVDFILN